MVGLSGITVAHFWTALILLGVGWNFAFVAATTMVTDCHRPEERNKVQAFNDFLIFGSMAIGSFISGSMLAHYGWYLVNIVMFPVVAVAGGDAAVADVAGPCANGLIRRGRVVQRSDITGDLRRCMTGRFLAYPRHIPPGRGVRVAPWSGAPAAARGPLPGSQQNEVGS